MNPATDGLLRIARALDEIGHSEDAAQWAADTQGYTPDAWQAQLLRSKRLNILVNCCRQTGKTRTAGTKAAHVARYQPGSIILIASHTQKQATLVQRWVSDATMRAQGPPPPANGPPRSATEGGPISKSTGYSEWRHIRDVEVWEADMMGGGRIVRRSVLSLELANGSVVESVPASPETVRGFSPNLIIVDEAAYVPDSVFDALGPMRAAHPCQLILLSSAGFKRGFFYREWVGEDEDWEKMQVLASDCPRITDAFLAKEREKMTSDEMFLREYYCRFMEQSGGVFKEEAINDMFIGAAPVEAMKADVMAEGEVYGLELCKVCGGMHNPLDRCDEECYNGL